MAWSTNLASSLAGWQATREEESERPAAALGAAVAASVVPCNVIPACLGRAACKKRFPICSSSCWGSRNGQNSLPFSLRGPLCLQSNEAEQKQLIQSSSTLGPSNVRLAVRLSVQSVVHPLVVLSHRASGRRLIHPFVCAN